MTDVTPHEVTPTQSPTHPRSKTWKGFVLAIALVGMLIASIWMSGFAAGRSNASQYTFEATVISIDPGADLSHYKMAAVGKQITITIDDSEFRTFQMNDPSMTECRSDGLAINSYYSEQNQSISACQGPRIHVVLFRPSQIP